MKLVETKLETRVNEAFVRVAMDLLPDRLREDDLTVWLLNTFESTKVDSPQRFPALGFEVNWNAVIVTATQNSLYSNTYFYLTSLLRIGRVWRVSELAAEAAQKALEPHNLRQTVLANLESYTQVLREMKVAPDHQHTFLSDSIGEIISAAHRQHLVRIEKAKRLWRGWKNEVVEFRSLANRCSAEFLSEVDEGKNLASIPQSVHDVIRFSFANNGTLNALLNDELEAGIIETSDVVAEMQPVGIVETENRPSRSGSTAIIEESQQRADRSSPLFTESKPERNQFRRVYATEAMRNLAVIGHGDAGKTQLISSLLYVAGATPRWGKVDEGTTVTDYDEDSIARKITLNIALAHLDHRDTKINLIDTPGYAAFVTHARPALRVADCALVVVDGVKGVEVQTEKTWAYANEFIVPRLMVITKLDKEHSDFGHALETAQNTFSRAIIPFTLPIGKEKGFRGVVDVVHMKAYELGADGQVKEIDIPGESRDLLYKTRKRLVELVAESDDALMEKYFEQGTLEESDILPNINKAIAQSKLCPVFAVSAATLVGLRALLNGIVDCAPDPAQHEAEYGYPEGGSPDSNKIARRYSDSEPFSAYCFRTVANPFAGRINVLKIMSGRLQTDASAYNSTRGTMEGLGALHTLQGNRLDTVSEAHAGDIVAFVKLKETQTGDTICDRHSPIVYRPVEYPEPAIAFAIEPKSRQDEEKISAALHKILEEDQALHFTRDAQTKGFLLSGSGQLHMETVIDKLKKRYGVQVTLHPPNVPYKETITVRAEVQGRYKKQTGGRGQFGDCKVVFEPLPRGSGIVFEDKIFGGAVPQQFRPAIEKGIIEAAKSGAIAGYPLVDFKVQLVDGSYHPVDSDEHSFRVAGRKAFRAAMEKVKPSLLEPVMDVEIAAPQEYSGDIMGDLNSRRGRVQGMETSGKQQVIKAQVPMAEMLNYQSTLNSITAARGSFHMQFSHYDPVPGQLAQKIVEQSRAEGRIRGGEEE